MFYFAGIFKFLLQEPEQMDMHHILLILPFLQKAPLTYVVEEINTRNFVMWIVRPSLMMVDIAVMLQSWYQLYRRKISYQG